VAIVVVTIDVVVGDSTGVGGDIIDVVGTPIVGPIVVGKIGLGSFGKIGILTRVVELLLVPDI